MEGVGGGGGNKGGGAHYLTEWQDEKINGRSHKKGELELVRFFTSFKKVEL